MPTTRTKRAPTTSTRNIPIVIHISEDLWLRLEAHVARARMASLRGSRPSRSSVLRKMIEDGLWQGTADLSAP